MESFTLKQNPKEGVIRILLSILCLFYLASCTNSSYDEVQSVEHSAHYQDERLLAQAWAMPVAAKFKEIGTEYQVNGSFCGPASAVYSLRSLGINNYDQKSILKSSSVSQMKVRFMGSTLDELATILRETSKKKVTVLRDISYEQFLQYMRQVNSPAHRYIINFHRGPLFGRGTGHHSPLGAFLPDSNLVLVLDVNESYKPFLVEARRLFDGINTIDWETGKKRGLIMIEQE